MSFTNETTHYGIPLPLGSDLTTPMDYNTSMEAVDTALFGAVGDAATATQDAADAKRTAQGAADDVTTLTGRLADDEATIASQGLAITGLQNAVSDVRTDLSDAIEAVKEPTATATYAHAVKDLFWYNDTLYRTTAPISIGDTIVPDTNCTTTTVATELARIEAEIPEVGTVSADDVTFDPTGTTIPATATDVDKALKALAPQGSVQVASDGVKTYATLLTELYALVDFTKITSKSCLVINAEYLHIGIYDTSNNTIGFTRVYEYSGGLGCIIAHMTAASKNLFYGPYNSVTDIGAQVVPAGQTMTIEY